MRTLGSAVAILSPIERHLTIMTDNQGHDLSYRTFINGVLSGNILIDTTQVATDTIDYVATDTWGNTATSTRTILIDASPSFVATFTNLHFTMTTTLADAGAFRLDGFIANPASGRATVTFTNPVFDLSGGTYDMKFSGSGNTDFAITGGTITGANVSSRFPQGLLSWVSGSGDTIALNTTTLKIDPNGDPFLNLESNQIYSDDNNTFNHNGASSRAWDVSNSGVASSLATWQSYTASGAWGAHDANSTSP